MSVQDDPLAEPTLDLNRSSASAWTIALRVGECLLLLDVADLRRERAREKLLARMAELAPALDVADSRAKLEAAGAEPWDAARRAGEDHVRGRAVALRDDEPADEPQDGAALLDDLCAVVRRHVVLPDAAVAACALWIVHSYALDAAEHSPRLVVGSPAMRCGKSTLLLVVAALVRRPLRAGSMTAATIYRALDAWSPTLLGDEADRWLADEDAAPAIIGVVNEGHSRDGMIARCVGDEHEPRLFRAYGAVALAAIGDARLADTIRDRAIRIPMRRRTADEPIERLRSGRVAEQCAPLRRRIVRWITDHRDRLAEHDPELPHELHDRAQDCWRPLVAIADLARGGWPARARAAAVALQQLADAESGDVESASELLLRHLRDLFATRAAEELPTAEILAALASREDAPWATWTRRGSEREPIHARGLARLLAPYGIRPRDVRRAVLGGSAPKGYRRADLADAWVRYCVDRADASLPPENSRDPRQPRQDPGVAVADRGSESATETNPRQRSPDRITDAADSAAIRGGAEQQFGAALRDAARGAYGGRS